MAGILLLGASATNNNRVSMNVLSSAFMNLAKNCNFSFPGGTTLNADGYPTSAVSAVSNPSLIPDFYGRYVIKWTGAMSMQFTGLPAIVYSGGAAVASFTSGGGPAGTGYATGNFTVTTAVSSPRVVFSIGTLVSGVSGGSGSLVTITHPSINSGSGFSTNTKVKFAVGCSANLIAGPNADGSWTVTNVSATSCTLNNSTGVVSPTVTGTGGVGTQTEAVRSTGGITFSYLNSGTFSSPSALVLCNETNETAIDSGLTWDPIYVAQLQEIKGTPGGVGRGGDFWLRFMDPTQVQGSYECDFSQRATLTTQCWTSQSNLILAYQAGAITNGGASGSFTDLYSCASNPSNSPASGPPIDCEVIQGTPSATNSGGLPGLTVAGRAGFGNWPIIDNTINPIVFNVTAAPASAGLSMQFTFTATWLNGGAPYVFTYTTVSGDTGSISALNANLVIALTADLTLRAGKIVFSNSARVAATPPTPLSGALTVSYTSGPAIVTVCSLVPSSIGTSGPRTFVFNALLGAFIYTGTTFVRSIPLETIVELCNRIGAHCWYNWPIYTKAAYITAVANFLASLTTGLTPGLKFGEETGNEMWNSFLAPWGKAQAYGISLGCFSFPYGSNQGPYSWASLRTIQYSALVSSAWNAVRSASDHYVFSMTQVDDITINGNFDRFFLKSELLTTTNAIYAAYGGIGGTASSTYTATGDRCVDKTTATGMAPYWGTPWLGGSASDGPNNVSGTVAENAAMLQASFDYASGLTSTAFASLTSQFNGTTTKSGGSTGAYNLGTSYLTRFNTQEALAASYDSYRTGAGLRVLGILHYEGGPQWGTAAFVNGVNSTSSLASSISSTDITTLTSRMTALGWTTGQLAPYTVSGLGTLSEVATNILQMTQGWKYDTDLNGIDVGTDSYKSFIKTYYYAALTTVSGANREARGCQYGYAGSQWGVMYSNYNAQNAKYENYYAITEYNA